MATKTKKPNWKPSEDDFETAFKVLAFMEDWFEENDPDADITIHEFHSVRMALPDSLDDLNTDTDTDSDDDTDTDTDSDDE